MSTRVKFVMALLVAAPLIGCATLSEQQRTLLVDGERAYREKQYQRATDQLSAFLGEVKQGPEVGRALYVRGMAAALVGQRPLAYSDLRRATQESSDPQLAWQPYVALGVLSFEDEDWGSALQALSTAVQRMPSAPPKDAVLFRVGLCNERLGRWGAAAGPYQRIVLDFPAGPYVENAKRRLQLQADHFAVQCGVFSRPENAGDLVNRLQQQGFRPQVKQEQRRDGTYSVVLEGRYSSYAEANHALARIRGYIPQAVLWP
jgi:tetratricopeptide (TPR) repeat protein